MPRLPPAQRRTPSHRRCHLARLQPATPPLRPSVTALAATPFIGGCVHSPHGTGRCKPPCRARRWAAGPPQRLRRGEAQDPLPQLSCRAAPAFGARRWAWPPASEAAVRPQALGRRRQRPRDGSRRRRAHPPRPIQPPPHQPLVALGWQAGPCLATGGADPKWASVPSPLGGGPVTAEGCRGVPPNTAKACSPLPAIGEGFMFPVPVDDTREAPPSGPAKGRHVGLPLQGRPPVVSSLQLPEVGNRR